LACRPTVVTTYMPHYPGFSVHFAVYLVKYNNKNPCTPHGVQLSHLWGTKYTTVPKVAPPLHCDKPLDPSAVVRPLVEGRICFGGFKFGTAEPGARSAQVYGQRSCWGRGRRSRTLAAVGVRGITPGKFLKFCIKTLHFSHSLIPATLLNLSIFLLIAVVIL
jgi:hypothetical protein